MSLKRETSVQNLVWQLDSGAGRNVVRLLAVVLLAVAAGAWYTLSTFQGLKSARAMEEAQVARQVAEGKGLTTLCVRPAEIGLEGVDGEGGWPELMHPPVWPLVLGGAMKVMGTPTSLRSSSYVNGWDYLPVGVAHLFMIGNLLWVWAIARRMFDGRAGVLSAVSFVLCDAIWRRSVAGDDWAAALFFSLGSVYFALKATDPVREGERVRSDEPLRTMEWLPALVASGMLGGLAVLTRYSAVSVELCVLLYVGCSVHRRGALGKALLQAAVVAAVVAPWVWRNLAVCGMPFGLAPYAVLGGTHLFEGDAAMRVLHVEMPSASSLLYAVQVKMMENLRAFATEGVGLGGCGVLLALFGAMYLHRFVRPCSRVLRWCLLAAGLAALLWASATGEKEPAGVALLWPLALPYAWAFFLVLADRVQFEYRVFSALAVAGVVVFSSLAFLLNLLPPRTGLPYPPYYHPYVQWVAGMLGEEEALASDIPWATAWYGGRTSVLLPKDVDGYYEVTRTGLALPLVYFTTETRNKPWVRGLADRMAPEYSWYQMFSSLKLPGDFPLRAARYVAGNDQMVLADRARWDE